MSSIRKLKYFLSILFLIFSFFLLFNHHVKAQTYSEEYLITNFNSDITLEKDTSLTVTETLDVFFPDPRHGIYRTIPIIYNANGKTTKAKLDVLSVEDKHGQKYKYLEEKLNQSVEIKIGDADKTVVGPVTYILKYQISDVVKRYENYDEIYWNITGHEWDTEIKSAKATIKSEFADIKNIDCFAGSFGGTDRFCDFSSTKSVARFTSTTNLGNGYDFTVVLAFDKNNNLAFPGPVESFFSQVLANWGYGVSILPFLVFGAGWLKKGRDRKYLADNVYFKPKDQKEITVPLLKREFLPLVYGPIDGLTPSQVGTIIDERVDIDDVISEILELARLGYLKIEKSETKKLFGKKVDYTFTKLKKDTLRLTDFQLYLLDSLFKAKSDKVALSSLKNTFYVSLSGFKERLYTSLKDKAFDGRPDTVRRLSVIKLIIVIMICLFVLISFESFTGNSMPLLILFIFLIPTFIFVFNMPRKTAWGYALYRQIKGLEYYLAKGKWRLEIAEKHQFFAEMLPLAVTLGIVNKLSNDMKELGIKPPDYFSGVTTGSLASDLGGFRTVAASTLTSSPSNSGSSSWSGGSGFSGGSSGGGFGGGGGGSW